MSKTKKIIIFAISLSLFVGLFIFIGFKTFNNNENKIDDFVLKTETITAELDETIDLKEYYSIIPKKNNINILCLIENSSFAQINDDKILTAKKIGTTKIYFKVNSGKNSFIEKTMSLIIKEKSILPLSISFEKDIVNLRLNTTNYKNTMIVNGENNINPIIEYSVNNICNYDVFTGNVTPLGIGSTTVTVKFILKDNVISNSFNVNVHNDYRIIEIKNLSFENGNYVFITKDTYPVLSVVIKENESQIQENLKIEIIKNENYTSVYQQEFGNIILQILETGESKLKISCISDETVYIIVKIIKE